MTYRTARRQIVSMIEAIPESSLQSPKVFGERFTHTPEMYLSRSIGRNRCFAMRSREAAGISVATAASSRRTQQGVEIVVDYPTHKEDDILDEVIWLDWRVLVDRLLDTTTWNRPASTIEAVTMERVDMRSVVEDVEDDLNIIGRRLVIQFILSHTEQTS